MQTGYLLISFVAVNAEMVNQGIIDAGFAKTFVGSDSSVSDPLSLRFSRQSYCRSQDKGGFYILLCRVMLSSVLTVNGEIQMYDVKMAVERGCDAVYSSSRFTTCYILYEFMFM